MIDLFIYLELCPKIQNLKSEFFFRLVGLFPLSFLLELLISTNFLRASHQYPFRTMSSHISEFYESIVEASDRGELWGLDQFSNKINQLEINFDPYVYK